MFQGLMDGLVPEAWILSSQLGVGRMVLWPGLPNEPEPWDVSPIFILLRGWVQWSPRVLVALSFCLLYPIHPPMKAS